MLKPINRLLKQYKQPKPKTVLNVMNKKMTAYLKRLIKCCIITMEERKKAKHDTRYAGSIRKQDVLFAIKFCHPVADRKLVTFWRRESYRTKSLQRRSILE